MPSIALQKEASAHFIIYSRTYCHLCDDMINALQNLKSNYQFSFDVIDIDADERLLQKYDELVPVLLWSKTADTDIQICNYFLDEDKVRKCLQHSHEP